MKHKKMKILILTSSLHYGGAETVIANLVRVYKEKKMDITIAHLKNIGAVGKELKAEGFNVIKIKHPEKGFLKYFSFYYLSEFIKKHRFDIVHTHTFYALWDLSLSKWFYSKFKHIHTYHFGNYPHLKQRYLIMEKWASQKADLLVTVSDYQRNILKDLYRLPDHKLITNWNGISPVEPEPDPELSKVIGRQSYKLIIGTIGSLIPQKGHDYFLNVAKEIIKKYPDVFFLIIGGGPEEEQLRKLSHDLQIENNVYFTGFFHNAAAKALPLFDVFFMPSRWEAMPIAILEAMAMGKPIVATRVGENEKIIDDGTNGYLCDNGDLNDMKNKLIRLIEDDSLRDKFGTKAKEKFTENFSNTIMANNYLHLYKAILGNPVHAKNKNITYN